MGPSQILNFPESYILIVCAFPLMGIFQVLCYIPVLPEMIERLQYKYDIYEGEDPVLDGRLNDKVNDVYAFFYALV
jgi:hypothetical protein